MAADTRRGLAWAFGAAFGIAGFAVPWKLAGDVGSTSTNTLLLLGSAAVFSTSLGIARTGAPPRPSRYDWGLAAALALLTLLGNLASAEAIRTLSPSLLVVTQRSEVILVALMAWPLIGERVDRRFWIGALIAAGGLAYLQGPYDATHVRAPGMVFAALSAVCFAGMAVVTRKYIRSADPVAVNTLRLWLSVAFWFAANGLPSSLLEIGVEQASYAALAAFAGPFAGRICMMHSARYLEARLTTLATLLAPVLTLALAWLVLSDLPTPRELLGGAIMLLGIALPLWPGSWRE